MATAVETATTLTNGTNGVNGVKLNEKIKSKNQLRRLKAKQKKAEKGATVSLINAVLFTTSPHTSRRIQVLMQPQNQSRRMGINL